MNYIFDKILKVYNIGNYKEEPIKLNGGITNKVFKINTTNGKYIVKIFSKNNIDSIEKTEEIAALAANNNINALCAIKLDNKYVQSINGLNIVVYPYYDGKVLLTRELTLEHIKILANALGHLHNIKIDKIDSIKKYKKNDFIYLYNLIDDRDCFKNFKNYYYKIQNIYDKVYESYSKLSNNYSYVHKDFNRKNILWNNMDYKIIDWETSDIDNPSIDLFNSIWFLSNDIEEDKFNIFIKEYLSITSLKDDYHIGVYAGLIEECNWLYFSLQRALRLNTNNGDEIKLGEESIDSSINEIINYYNKIDLMIKLIDNINK